MSEANWDQWLQAMQGNFAAILASGLLSQVEIQNMIRASKALQDAYDKADELERGGYQQLAAELRSSADAISLTAPGQLAMQHLQALLGGEPSPVPLPKPGTPVLPSPEDPKSTASTSEKKPVGRPAKKK